jgi:hypothetical protein
MLPIMTHQFDVKIIHESPMSLLDKLVDSENEVHNVYVGHRKQGIQSYRRGFNGKRE